MTVHAVSYVTAVWVMARPTIAPLVPIVMADVMADSTSTLPTKILPAPMVRAVPRNHQKIFSGLAPPRNDWILHGFQNGGSVVIRMSPLFTLVWTTLWSILMLRETRQPSLYSKPASLSRPVSAATSSFEVAPKRDTNLYKSCILLVKINSLPNLVRDKGIYSTRAGSILTCAGPAWDLRVQAAYGTRR